MMTNVLLIDDDEVYNFLNRSLIEISGFSKVINTCKSAKQGLNMLETSPVDALPDVILLDIQMPDIDGHGFLSYFAKLPSTIREKTKIAMLTSSLDPDDRAKSFKYESVIDFIEKPLNQNKLQNLRDKMAAQVA